MLVEKNKKKCDGDIIMVAVSHSTSLKYSFHDSVIAGAKKGVSDNVLNCSYSTTASVTYKVLFRLASSPPKYSTYIPGPGRDICEQYLLAIYATQGTCMPAHKELKELRGFSL